MRHRVCFVSLFACLLALAACGSTPSSNASSTSTPTTAAQPTPTNTPATSFTVYTSPDHLTFSS